MAVTSTTGTLASSGVGSGLDVSGIVSKLMTVESQPLKALATKEASYQARISAYGSLKSALGSFQSSLSGLLSLANIKSVSATLADSSLASAAASSSAVPGSYALSVTRLATAQKLVSTGFASTNTAVGAGTLTFSFGTTSGTNFTANPDAPAKSVIIATGQSTLAGIRDAVNAAGIGVAATIVNDGTASGNRLVFTSSATGAANSLRITTADADATHTDTSGLSQLAYDPAATAGNGKNLTQKVAAQDATLVVDGIQVVKATNTITDAIQGVTLNLAKADENLTTTLTVATDTSGVVKSVQNFVKGWNELAAAIGNLTKYDTSGKKAAVLTGDSAPRVAQSQLRSIIGTALSGNGMSLTVLSQIGVSLKADGSLSLDTSKLTAALGRDATAVGKLFAAATVAGDSLITASTSGGKAQPGTYAIEITQLATQGKAVGSAVAGLTIAAGVNDQLAVTVDGIESIVTLAAGTYATAAALASEIQSKVNGGSMLAATASRVTVAEAGGVLTMTSNRYGSGSTIAITGTAASNLFGTATTTSGVDVAGSIGGSPATGSGQALSGAVGSATEGIGLVVTGGSTGVRGDVTYSQGYAVRLDAAVSRLLAADGVLASSTDGVTKRITDISKQRETMQARLEKVEATYLAKFRALDTMLASMNSTSSYLTQQLDALAALRDQIAGKE